MPAKDTADRAAAGTRPRRSARAEASADPNGVGVESAAMSWEQARQVAAGLVRPLPVVTLSLAHCVDRVLARPLLARCDLPAFDTAAMDGWAVAGPGPWRVHGMVLAGGASVALSDGEAARIATGARLPQGATAVLRHERSTLAGRLLHGDAPMAKDIRPRGQECRAGEELLPAGVRITPAALGLAAAAGYDDLPVVDRPRVDVLVLGDELLDSGAPHDGQIRDALGPLVAPWLRELGADVPRHRRVRDSLGALRNAVERSTADVVVTTGGTARGPVDFVHRMLADLRAELVIDGVAVRPGHPMLVARFGGGRFLVGLPGNPLAAVAGVLTLLTPMLSKLAGRGVPAARWTPLDAAVDGFSRDTRLVPVTGATPLRFTGPAMLRGLALADGVAVVPPGGLPRGAPTEVLPLPR
jgi:molybdopterin molybdotransferase